MLAHYHPTLTWHWLQRCCSLGYSLKSCGAEWQVDPSTRPWFRARIPGRAHVPALPDSAGDQPLRMPVANPDTERRGIEAQVKPIQTKLNNNKLDPAVPVRRARRQHEPHD